MQTLIIAIVVLIVLGLLTWAVNASPIPQPFKWAVIVLLILVACIYLLNLVGVLA